VEEVGRPVLHQFIVGAVPGDAITDHSLLLKRWLCEAGFRSDIFAESVHPALTDEVQPYLRYHPSEPREIIVLHHSIGSTVVDHLLSLDVQFLLIYHSVTPPEFLRNVDPALAEQLARGQSQLASLRKRTLLGLADSLYNETELRKMGYGATGVLPIVLDESKYQSESNPALLARYRDGGPYLLFVGRLVPNKRQEDLIKLLYHYRRSEPSAGLFLVGDPWVPEYAEWLRELAQELGLDDAVIFTGHVSQRDLVTYYRLADLYVSMSEHEGFGKPLMESMYFGIPVVAYRAAAVPDTLAGAGTLFKHKDFEALAELLSILVRDEGLRERIVLRQRERVQQFLEPHVRNLWEGYISGILTAY
jgi:glycosyltransferase involved in cell wall biosynthesis